MGTSLASFVCVEGGICSWLMLNTILNTYLKYKYPLNSVISNSIN